MLSSKFVAFAPKIILSLALCWLWLLLLVTPLKAATPYGEGALIKASTAEVFLVSAEQALRWIPNEVTFNALGFSWTDIITVDDEVLLQYSFGSSLTAIEPPTTLPTAVEVENRVREYFADIPIMIEIAKCESGLHQYNDDGSLVAGYQGLYIGIFQIDKNIHGEYAKSLGMDIETVEGNMAYARRLYEARGSKPWPTCAVLAAPLKSALQLGDQGTEVKALQKILNKAGFVIAASGVGSPGQETEYFGSLTRQAVQRFQCAQNIVCSGNENTTGYGLVGPKLEPH
jgi:hypothetical protein